MDEIDRDEQRVVGGSPREQEEAPARAGPDLQNRSRAALLQHLDQLEDLGTPLEGFDSDARERKREGQVDSLLGRLRLAGRSAQPQSRQGTGLPLEGEPHCLSAERQDPLLPNRPPGMIDELAHESALPLLRAQTVVVASVLIDTYPR